MRPKHHRLPGKEADCVLGDFLLPESAGIHSPVNVIDSQTYYFACSQPQTSQQKSDGSFSQPIGRVWITGRNNAFDLIG
jgi:hypothetical protein